MWSNYNSLGSAYFAVGENDRALAAFQHITELEPGRAEGWEGVGTVYFRLGRWSESLSRFQKAIDLQPKATFYSNLGTAYYFLGLFDKAAATFEKAASMMANDGDIRLNLADAYRWSGQSAKAAASLRSSDLVGLQEHSSQSQGHRRFGQPGALLRQEGRYQACFGVHRAGANH